MCRKHQQQNLRWSCLESKLKVLFLDPDCDVSCSASKALLSFWRTLNRTVWLMALEWFQSVAIGKSNTTQQHCADYRFILIRYKNCIYSSSSGSRQSAAFKVFLDHRHYIAKDFKTQQKKKNSHESRWLLCSPRANLPTSSTIMKLIKTGVEWCRLVELTYCSPIRMC